MKIVSRKIAFSTPWFDLIAKNTDAASEREDRPHYCLMMPDYVSVVALTPAFEVILVRQFRPAVEQMTVELPSGHVDSGESAESSAARELYEETGYRALSMELLGVLRPDTGRLSNKVWYFLALDAVKDMRWSGIEEGIEPFLKPIDAFIDDIRQARFDHSLNLAPVLLALLRNERFRKKVNLAGSLDKSRS